MLRKFGLNKVFGYFREHFREDSQARGIWIFYGILAAMLITLFWVNFFMPYGSAGFQTFEEYYIQGESDDFISVSRYFLYYAVPYFIVAISYLLLTGRKRTLRSPGFWLHCLFALLVLALNSGLRFHLTWLRDVSPPQALRFWHACMSNALSIPIFLLPILAFKLVMDRKEPGLYGFTRHNFDYRPYLLMVILMIPLIVWASFLPDFLGTYPTYKHWLSQAEEYYHVSEWATTLCYQFFYIADFTFVELLFRGFMVIGLMKVFGRGAIYSMVVVYAMLHFGKPFGEALSSIFGGFILGVIAYGSRNIWGGVIIHAGIAFMMEWAALLQYEFGNGKALVEEYYRQLLKK